MRRLFVVLLFSILAALVGHAQKKELAQAETDLKKGKNQVQIEQTMMKLLKDSVNRENKKIYLTLFEAIRQQYDQGNMKLYLKQQYDTAALFVSAKKMFTVLEELDSIEARPDKKGRVRIEYRNRHSDFLNQYRRNIFNGGVYHANKLKFAQAYEFFDLYIDCAHKPLFSKFRYDSLDVRMPVAAYWAVLCGYKSQDAAKTLKHSQLALTDSAHLNYTLQYLAETYKMVGNTNCYVETLKAGFRHDCEFPFFYPRLLDYYSGKGDLDSAMCVVNRLLEKNDSAEIYLFAKSALLLNMGKYAECIDICKSLLAKNDSMPEVYLNMGLSYVNLAVETERVSKSRNKRVQITSFYKSALPYMERYRKMMPAQKDKWAPVLYNIYLNLNMGKQFDEMDKLLH